MTANLTVGAYLLQPAGSAGYPVRVGGGAITDSSVPRFQRGRIWRGVGVRTKDGIGAIQLVRCWCSGVGSRGGKCTRVDCCVRPTGINCWYQSKEERCHMHLLVPNFNGPGAKTFLRLFFSFHVRAYSCISTDKKAKKCHSFATNGPRSPAEPSSSTPPLQCSSPTC